MRSTESDSPFHIDIDIAKAKFGLQADIATIEAIVGIELVQNLEVGQAEERYAGQYDRVAEYRQPLIELQVAEAGDQVHTVVGAAAHVDDRVPVAAPEPARGIDEYRAAGKAWHRAREDVFNREVEVIGHVGEGE